ncbi:MAG: hypothetical protein WCQ32_01590 [bacterium]
MTHEELYTTFMDFVEKNDEIGARQFLIDHLNDFPEEIRKQIAFEFFVDAVKKDEAIESIQKRALEIITQE